MSLWTTMRVTFCFIIFLLVTFYMPALPADIDMPLSFLVICFVFGIVGLLIVVGIQKFNPWSAPQWQHPSWSSNPFTMREPLLFFHFAAHFMISSGSGVLASSLLTTNTLTPASFTQLLFGLGLLCGVQLCTVVFHSKMHAEDDTER